MVRASAVPDGQSSFNGLFKVVPSTSLHKCFQVSKYGPAATLDYNLPAFQANLLHNNARVSVWQHDELLESHHPRDVAQIGVGQTFHFVF